MSDHEHHHHHHELSADAVKGRAFLFGIVLNTLFVIGEFAAGFLFQSMGLLADAGHNLGDVSGLLSCWPGSAIAKITPMGSGRARSGPRC